MGRESNPRKKCQEGLSPSQLRGGDQGPGGLRERQRHRHLVRNLCHEKKKKMGSHWREQRRSTAAVSERRQVGLHAGGRRGLWAEPVDQGWQKPKAMVSSTPGGCKSYIPRPQNFTF